MDGERHAGLKVCVHYQGRFLIHNLFVNVFNQVYSKAKFSHRFPTIFFNQIATFGIVKCPEVYFKSYF